MDFLDKAGVKYLIRLHKGNYEGEKAGMNGDDDEVEFVYTKARLAHLRKKSPERALELAGKKSAVVRIIKTVFANGEAASFMTNA